MVDGCAPSCTKAILILANLLVCILGAAVFGVAIWASFDASFSDTLEESLVNVTKDTTGLDLSGDLNTLSTMIWVLCGFGAFVFLVGLMGCWGAWAESRCCLGLYFIIVLACALIELGLAIAIMSGQTGLEGVITKAVNATRTSHPEAFKGLKKELDCCGVTGKEIECLLSTKTGCAAAAWTLISHGLVTLGTICIIAVVVELFALVSACVLCTALGKRVGYTEFV